MAMEGKTLRKGMKLNDNNVTVGLELVKEILLVASEKKFSCSSSLLLWLPFSNDLVLGMNLVTWFWLSSRCLCLYCVTSESHQSISV